MGADLQTTQSGKLVRLKLAAAVSAVSLMTTGCTTAELEAISAGLSQGLAEASYNNPYGNSAYYGSGYTPSPYNMSGGYWTPNTFGSYGGWPSGTSYGQWVGYNGCSYIGSYYTCDTNGDGYADMYGDTDDGSYASSSLRVNGRGEAFTWGENGWERNRAYDGPRQPDEVIVYDGD